MAPTTPTATLVVKAAVKGSSVSYTIQPSASDKTEVKATRFSELHNLHKSLKAEVPSFSGRFPSKTWSRKTSPAFVESRRKEIELYLRLVASHRPASASKAWQSFLGDASSQSQGSSENVGSEDGADSEPNTNSWTSELGTKLLGRVGDSFKSEMGSIMVTKKDEFTAVQEAKQGLEGDLASGEEAARAAEVDAQERAALEAEAAGCLRAHRLSLEELEAGLAAKKSVWGDKEHRQNELVKRFEEKVALASESVKAAEVSLESSQRACSEAIASATSKVAEAVANQTEAETANIVCIEGHAAMTEAMPVLQETAKSHLDEFKAAERELEMFRVTEKTLFADLSGAETTRCQAESEATAAVAAVTAHTADAARRSRAQDAELRRAEERAADLIALRDMPTRGPLREDNSSSCKAADDEAAIAAEKAVEAVAKATQLREETKATDEQKLQSLQVLAGKATRALGNRESVAAAIAARLEETKALVQKATTKHEVLRAAHQAIDKELENVKLRLESLAEPLTECAARSEEAKKAVVASRRKAEEEQTAFHHAVDADTQLLKRLQEEEASLMQALDEAKKSAAEAHERAAMPMDESEAEDSRAQLDSLVKSSEGNFKQTQMRAKEAAEAYQLAISKAKDARIEMEDHELDASSDDASSDRQDAAANARFAQRRARLERRLRKREEAVQETKELSEAAAKAVPIAKVELEALQAQLKAAPILIRRIEKLVREELAIVDAKFQSHADKENEILAAATQRMADWKELKLTLSADLHRVELEYGVAKLNVKATKDLALCLASA